MIRKVDEGISLKCPVCGSTDIYWLKWYYVSLKCGKCGFESYPENEFAKEEEFVEEWKQTTENYCKQ